MQGMIELYADMINEGTPVIALHKEIEMTAYKLPIENAVGALAYLIASKSIDRAAEKTAEGFSGLDEATDG